MRSWPLAQTTLKGDWRNSWIRSLLVAISYDAGQKFHVTRQWVAIKVLLKHSAYFCSCRRKGTDSCSFPLQWQPLPKEDGVTETIVWNAAWGAIKIRRNHQNWQPSPCMPRNACEHVRRVWLPPSLHVIVTDGQPRGQASSAFMPSLSGFSGECSGRTAEKQGGEKHPPAHHPWSVTLLLHSTVPGGGGWN